MKRTIQWSTLGFFFLLLITGIFVYKDYGIPWDEPGQVQLAVLNHRYIFQHDPALFYFTDRYYGVIFELPYLWITTHIPIARHLLIFLTFFLGVVVFYCLGRRLFHSPGWALIACVLFTASPRIFADSFYNSKDIPFLVVTETGILVLLVAAGRLRTSQTWLRSGLWTALLALTSATMIDTRVVGIMILPLVFFILGFDFFLNPTSWVKYLSAFAGYLLLTMGFVILFWPILWEAPWTQFMEAFHKMSQYPFVQTILYMGNTYGYANLPWHYLPVWIGITTPLIVLAGLLPGFGNWAKSMIFEIRKLKGIGKLAFDLGRLEWIVVVLWLVIPCTAVYVFHSSLYDAWRHMYFLYPALVLISILGLKSIYEYLLQHFPLKKGVQVLGGLVLLAGIAEPVWFMARYHPFENVYFNLLAGDPSTLRNRFELDYWGLSYKQAIDYILAHDSRPAIKLAFANPSAENYVDYGLPAAQMDRIKIVAEPEEADYFLTEFRWHPQDYPYPNEYYSIEVRGTVIMAVFRMQGVSRGP